MIDDIEIHSIGDENYKIAIVVTDGYAISSNELDTVIGADYTQAFTNIDVSSGLIYHGQGGVIKPFAHNFSEYVFSDASGSVSVDKVEKEATAIDVYPNPVQVNTPLLLELENETERWINAYDVLGQKVQSIQTNEVRANLSFEQAGTYFIQIIEGNTIVQAQKVQVYE